MILIIIFIIITLFNIIKDKSDLYLSSYCYLKGASRIFKISRIDELKIMKSK